MVRNWKQKLISLLLKNFYHRILYDPILHLLSTFYFIYTGLSLFVHKVSEDGWWRRLMIQGGGDTVLHLYCSCRSFLLSPQCGEKNFAKNSLVSLKKSTFPQCWKGNRSQMVRNWKSLYCWEIPIVKLFMISYFTSWAHFQVYPTCANKGGAY